MSSEHSRNDVITSLRARILACHKCSKLGLVCSPRYSTGGKEVTKLVLLAQNPPADPVRSLHGAYMLHYDGELGPHERLVRDLVEHFQVDRKHVMASQVVKCATPGNRTPKPWEERNCHDWLVAESALWDSAPVIVFGAMARQVVRSTFALWHVPYTRRLESKSQIQYRVDVQGRFIFAPHPSVVNRFIDRTDWMYAIRDSMAYLQLHDIILKHQDFKRPPSLVLPTHCPFDDDCVGIPAWHAGMFNGFYCDKCRNGGQVWEPGVVSPMGGDVLNYVRPF